MGKASSIVIYNSLCFIINPRKEEIAFSVGYHTDDDAEFWKEYVILPLAQSSKMEPWF